jgi:hypothetical protein
MTAAMHDRHLVWSVAICTPGGLQRFVTNAREAMVKLSSARAARTTARTLLTTQSETNPRPARC